MSHTIEDALLALASRDRDMASLANNVGFNGADTVFGNSLAAQVRIGKPLTYRQLAPAWKMLRKYAVQLERDHGIRFSEIPQPVAPADAEPTVVTGSAWMRDGSVVVKFTGYPGKLLQLVKDVPGARYDRNTQEWVFGLTPHNVPYVETWPDSISVGADVKAAIAEVMRDEVVSHEASRATEADLDLPWAGDLYGFQRAGVRYALDHKRTLIGDEMGLGKTVQAIATIEVADAYPALLVVPAVVKLNWQRELGRWLPGRTVEVLSGREPNGQELGADFIIINYDILTGWLDKLRKMPWGAVVFDESHYLKNHKAKRTKAAKGIAKTVPMRLLLTGTPILNRPVELISQLDILGRLDSFGGFWPFARRYCGAVMTSFGWDLKGASNLKELNDKLRASCLVRRTKDQVLGDLPPKVRATVPIEFDRTHYEEVARDLKVWLKERLLLDKAFLARIEELREAGADAEAEAEAEAWRKERAMGRAAMLVKIEALKQAGAEGKLPVAVEWIREFLAAGRKLVVFAHHKNIVQGIADGIREAGYGVVTLTGETQAQARQTVVDRFQTDDEVRLFVGNIQAAGVGITLTAASDVAFVELPWRPGDLTQAEDRCHRIGQEDSVTCWYLLAAKTIEERIARMIDGKRVVVDAATDGKEGMGAGESLAEALMDAIEKEGVDE